MVEDCKFYVPGKPGTKRRLHAVGRKLPETNLDRHGKISGYFSLPFRLLLFCSPVARDTISACSGVLSYDRRKLLSF